MRYVHIPTNVTNELIWHFGTGVEVPSIPSAIQSALSTIRCRSLSHGLAIYYASLYLISKYYFIHILSITWPNMDRRQTVAQNVLVIVAKVNPIAPKLTRLHLDISWTNADNLPRRSLEAISNKVCISTTEWFTYVNFENKVWQTNPTGRLDPKWPNQTHETFCNSVFIFN